MHIQVVNFNLEGINHDDFMQIADTAAPAFAGVPGLVSKVWLCDQENNTYGGVYIWETEEAMQNYLESELFHGVGANPALANAESKEFEVIAVSYTHLTLPTNREV